MVETVECSNGSWITYYIPGFIPGLFPEEVLEEGPVCPEGGILRRFLLLGLLFCVGLSKVKLRKDVGTIRKNVLDERHRSSRWLKPKGSNWHEARSSLFSPLNRFGALSYRWNRRFLILRRLSRSLFQGRGDELLLWLQNCRNYSRIHLRTPGHAPRLFWLAWSYRI